MHDSEVRELLGKIARDIKGLCSAAVSGEISSIQCERQFFALADFVQGVADRLDLAQAATCSNGKDVGGGAV